MKIQAMMNDLMTENKDIIDENLVVYEPKELGGIAVEYSRHI